MFVQSQKMQLVCTYFVIFFFLFILVFSFRMGAALAIAETGLRGRGPLPSREREGKKSRCQFLQYAIYDCLVPQVVTCLQLLIFCCFLIQNRDCLG